MTIWREFMREGGIRVATGPNLPDDVWMMTSVDMTGDVTLTFNSEFWKRTDTDERARLVRDHQQEVRAILETLAIPDDLPGRLVRYARVGSGVLSIAMGGPAFEMTFIPLVEVALSSGAALTVVGAFAPRRFLARGLIKLVHAYRNRASQWGGRRAH